MAMGTDKAKISVKQREIMAINDKLELIRKNLDVYERSGLRKSKEARKLVGDLNELIFERDELIKEDIRDRRDCIAYLLLCIAAADFSREACDLLKDKLKKTYGTVQEGQLDFLKTVGCKNIQGFLLAYPMPKEKYLDRFVNKPEPLKV